MQITPSYFNKFKQNYANRNNLRFSNTLAIDIFERKSISFTGENLFSKDEQKKLNDLKLNHLRNRISELKTFGLSFDEAIACLYFSDDQIKQFKDIKDKTLTIEDKIGLVAYEIVDIERFKEVKTQLPKQYEALLATKFNLSNGQIDTYKDLSRKVISIEYFDENDNLKKYTPSTDEWMICVKEGFNETQLSRFAQLRNRTKSFEGKTVRKQEEQQAYPIEYIISCVKENKSDEDIAREDKLLDKYVSFLGGFYNIYDGLLAKTFHEHIYDRNALGLILHNFYEKETSLETKSLIHEIWTDAYDTQDKKYMDFFIELDKLAPDEIDIFASRFKKYYKTESMDTTLKIALLNDSQYERFENFKEMGFNDFTRYELAKLSSSKRKLFFDYIQNGINPNCAIKFVNMTQAQIIEFKKLKANNLFTSLLIRDPKSLELKSITDENAQLFVANLPLGTSEELIKIHKNFNIPIILTYIFYQLDDIQKGRYFEYLNNGTHYIDAIDIASLNEDEYLRFCNLNCVKNISEKCILARLNLNKSDMFSMLETIRYFHMDWAEYSKLSKAELKKYDEFTQKYSRYKSERAIEYAKLNEDQHARFLKFIDMFGKENFGKAIAYAKLTESEFNTYKKLPLKLPSDILLYFVQNTTLSQLTPEFFEKLPDDFWYKINTGSEEETHEIIQKAIAELLLEKRGKYSSINLTPLKTLGCQLEKPGQGNTTVLYNKGTEYSLNKNNGDFELKTQKPFTINLSQGLINQKPILIVKDKKSDNQYISYNGAIARVQSIQNHDSNQFEDWGNILPQKQAKILAQAADEFVFNLFDENGNCIIGQNSPTFNTKDKLDIEIEQYYSEKLLELKNKNQLNTQEILKLMPKNCMLTINPYIQDADFKYAVVCEWFSKDGHRWQMEIHSQDLKWNNDENWIFRLHKQTQSGRQYFQFTDNENGFNFNGATLDSNAHIKIPTPLEENDLLNNVEFQTIINQISSKQYENYEIGEIADSLKITKVENNTQATINNIIDHCLKNPLAFARYKDIILKLRASLGMVELI